MYLQLFPSKSHPHYLRLHQAYSQSMSAENIFPLYQLFLEIWFPIFHHCQTTCVQFFFWNMTYSNLSAYQFHHSDKKQWGQGAPMYQANIYFGLSLHPRSTQLPALRIPCTNLTSPWDPHPHQCSHCHFSWDCSIGLLQWPVAWHAPKLGGKITPISLGVT